MAGEGGEERKRVRKSRGKRGEGGGKGEGGGRKRGGRGKEKIEKNDFVFE